MKIKDLFEKWGLKKISVNAFGLADLEFKPAPEDQEAAWELYIELITRITTQEFGDDVGVEETALESVYNLFKITRIILKEKGRKCVEFSKVAIIMLNEIIRPFTAKWHKILVDGKFDNNDNRQQFRNELKELQTELCRITFMLSQIAKVADSTDSNTLLDTSFMDNVM